MRKDNKKLIKIFFAKFLIKTEKIALILNPFVVTHGNDSQPTHFLNIFVCRARNILLLAASFSTLRFPPPTSHSR